MQSNYMIDNNAYRVLINNFSGRLFIKGSEVQGIINAGKKMAAQLKDEIKSWIEGPINLRCLYKLGAACGLKLRIINAKSSTSHPSPVLAELNLKKKEIKLSRRLFPQVRYALKRQAIDIKTRKLCEIVLLHELLHFYLAGISNISGAGKLKSNMRQILTEEVAISELIKEILPLTFNPIVILMALAGIKRAPAAQLHF